MALDIAKGIGIILVVWCHAGGPFDDAIYYFHMPFFFLLSGYLFSEKYSFGQFFRRKLETLYLPFIIWNLMAVSIRVLSHNTDLISGLQKAFFILITMDKDRGFFTPTWFLGALFLVSVIYKLLDSRMQAESRKKGFFLLAFCLAVACVSMAVELPFTINRTLVLSFFYALGRVARDNIEELKRYSSLPLALLSGMGFCLLALNIEVDIGDNEYENPLLFYVGVMLASYVCVYASVLIEKYVKYVSGLLAYLGRESLCIVIWHFVAFRLYVMVQMHMDENFVWTEVDDYVTYNDGGFNWIIYMLVGIAGSLVIWNLLKKPFWGKYLQKIHAIV